MTTPRKRRNQDPPDIFRCAVYTRVNVGSGRHALRVQRKAIHAFLTSRRSQGWVRLAPTYEDAGQSAGHLRRPALQSLLADIDVGKVDCVVVYDLARLTRSEADQAELFARFRDAGVALVTVCPECFYDLGTKAVVPKAQAVAYHRDSARGTSLPIQRDRVREWADKNGLEIVREFSDGEQTQRNAEA